MTPTPDLRSAATDLDAVVEDAIRVAREAAGHSGVEIREIDQLSELDEVGALLSVVWNRDANERPLTTSLLRALSNTGNYVAGAFLDGRLIGAAVAFFASPPIGTIHSHITGVDAGAPARGVGYALKLHQRAWALSRGVAAITWTFDPLIRRNAHFNLTKLGARATQYLPNFYGEMTDGLNAGEESDRLLVQWDLLAPGVGGGADASEAVARRDDGLSVGIALAVAPDGGPELRRWDGPRTVLAVPADVERMRVQAPTQARAWRLALRDLLGGAMADGARVVGFHRTEGYVVEAPGDAG